MVSQQKGCLCCAGDPVRLFHHLGAGVWSFLASPAAGLVEGARGRAPQRLAAGIAAGLRGLLSNTVYGFSNATAKMSGAARKVRAFSSHCRLQRDGVTRPQVGRSAGSQSCIVFAAERNSSECLCRESV